MKDLLKDIVSKQIMCSVFTDSNNTNKFSVGYLCALDDDFFLMESIDQYGKHDGFFCEPIDRILKVEVQNSYCNDIEKLFKHLDQERVLIIESGEGAIVDIIKYANKNRKICSFELCESENNDVIGFIIQCGKEKVSIQAVSEDGREDGNSIVDLSAVSRISCDSSEDKKIKLLYELKKKD